MKALKDHGIAVDEKLICHGDYTIQGGVQAVEELVKENPDMTAVFVTNYEMTMGAVIGLNEMGVSMERLDGREELPDHIVRKLQTDIFMGKSIRRQG